MTAVSEWTLRDTGIQCVVVLTSTALVTYGPRVTWKSLTSFLAPTCTRVGMRHTHINPQRWRDSLENSHTRPLTMCWLYSIESEPRIRILRKSGYCMASRSLWLRRAREQMLDTEELLIQIAQLSHTRMEMAGCGCTHCCHVTET